MQNTDNNRIVISELFLTTVNQLYIHNTYLEFRSYNFMISYDSNNTSLSNISYSLKAGEVILFEDSNNTHLDSENEFTICSSNIDCYDYDGCTINICNETTKTYYNINE